MTNNQSELPLATLDKIEVMRDLEMAIPDGETLLSHQIHLLVEIANITSLYPKGITSKNILIGVLVNDDEQAGEIVSKKDIDDALELGKKLEVCLVNPSKKQLGDDLVGFTNTFLGAARRIQDNKQIPLTEKNRFGQK